MIKITNSETKRAKETKKVTMNRGSGLNLIKGKIRK
jgi:hypothetical protein